MESALKYDKIIAEKDAHIAKLEFEVEKLRQAIANFNKHKVRTTTPYQ